MLFIKIKRSIQQKNKMIKILKFQVIYIYIYICLRVGARAGAMIDSLFWFNFVAMNHDFGVVNGSIHEKPQAEEIL